MQNEAGHFLIPPNAGKTVALGGIGVIYKVSGSATGGAFAIVEHPIEPGTLVPPHTHSREDELSYVLEGNVGVRVGDQIIEATPGSYVFKPKGIPHTFWNAGPAPARLIEIIFPSGFETYFGEMAALLSAGGPPDPGEVTRLANKYGMSYQMEWIAELVANYHIKLRGP